MSTDRSPELEALDVLVGTWTVAAPAWDLTDGRTTFEWALEGRYLIQRSEVPDSPVPSSMSVIAPDGDGYTQHYFDSRGVTRLYRMTLRDGLWTLTRTTEDFSPLDFAQRYIGTFSADGDVIDGQWETSRDGGGTWELDFALSYTRDR